jgi:hypothetical protein
LPGSNLIYVQIEFFFISCDASCLASVSIMYNSLQSSSFFPFFLHLGEAAMFHSKDVVDHSNVASTNGENAINRNG